MSNVNNRVVVTGIGTLTPLGLDIATMWQGLITGKSGIDHITLFDAALFETKIAGEVKGFEPTNYMSHKDVRRTDRFAQLAVAASLQAVEQSEIKINTINQDKIGIIIGSGIGGLTTLFEQTKILLEKGADRVSPFLIPNDDAQSSCRPGIHCAGGEGANSMHYLSLLQRRRCHRHCL